MIKIVQINTTLNVGSHGKIAEQIGMKIIESRFDSYIAYGRDMHESHSHSIKIGGSVSIFFHYLMTRLFDAHGLWSRSATRHFVNQLKVLKPDLIHLHNIHGYYLNYPILFKYLSELRIPVVWTLHDCWPMMGHCSNPDNEGCERWMKECYNCPLKHRDYPQSYLFDNSRRNYRLKKEFFTSLDNLHVVVVSNWLKTIVERSFLKRFPIDVIYNGIDVGIFKPTENNLREKLNLQDKFVILGVSNVWNSYKGFNDFISLANSLDNSFCIILIGVNNHQIKLLPPNIIGVPKTDNQLELVKYYSMADVVMSLSYQETFGLTIVEGMACGTPAIVYNRTATPELVTKETGIVAHAGSTDSIMEAIAQIKSKSKKSYSVACRKRAVEHFNKEDRCQDYINLYNRLLNGKSGTC